MNKLAQISVSLLTVLLLTSCSGGGSSDSAAPVAPVTPGPNTKTSYTGQPANLSGWYRGVTQWTTATGSQNVDILFVIEQNASSIKSITISPNKSGASGTVFNFGGGFRTTVISGNELFEKLSGEAVAAVPYGEIGAIGFYINKPDFANIEVTRISNTNIHLRLKAAHLSPTVTGNYVETYVEGDLALDVD